MSALQLLRDGTIVGPQGTKIDFRTPDYSVWLTVKANSDAEAERVAAALEAAFSTEAALQRPTPECTCSAKRSVRWQQHASNCPAGCPPPESSR